MNTPEQFFKLSAGLIVIGCQWPGCHWTDEYIDREDLASHGTEIEIYTAHFNRAHADHRRITGQELGRIICDTFGLDAARTKDITIHANVHDAAQVDVTMFVLDSQGKRLNTELRRYTLHDETPQ